MFDNTNHYELRIEKNEDCKKYFAIFVDSNNQRVEEEISRAVAKTMFVDFVRIERNLLRWDERHMEFSDLTEGSLNKRALYPSNSIEEEVFKKISCDQLYEALKVLNETQQRRIKLYYFEKLTYAEIGSLENCQKTRVKKSIDRAIKKLRKII